MDGCAAAIDDREVVGLEARKVQELLVYLLLHRHRPHSREVMATLFWGDRSDAQAKKYLRQTLWQLQTSLNNANGTAPELLLVDSEWVEVSPAATFWLDVATFEQVFDTARLYADADLPQEQVDALCRAVALYQGDLLEGWYHDWCIFERERLQGMFLAMLDKLVGYAEKSSDYAMGIHYCELALRCDQARERTHRRLMRLHYGSGNRTAALRQYETCAAMLRRELGVEPAGSTVELYRQLCGDSLPENPAPSRRQRGAESDAGNLSDVLQRLQDVHNLLSTALHQVQQDIETVEQLIHR